MKLFTSNKGAVSVFLVIILVPTLIVTSLFTDVSRMFLSKSVTESAADLALNSQLSQFDKELNEIYGLFATAKNTDEVSSNLQKYFESCLVSSGVETTDASRYGAMLTDLIDEELGDEYVDLLQIDTENAAITPVAGGNLGNPQVVKNQIVEFMKYRGPVSITQNFLGKLTSIKDKTDIVDDETEVTDKMNNYYESESKVLKHLYDAYQDMKKYNNEGGMSEEFINNVKTLLNGLEGEYRNQHIKMFKDLYNTQGKSNIIQSLATTTSFKTYFKSKSIKDMKEETAEDKFDSYVKDAQKAVDNFEKNVYNKAVNLYNNYFTPYATFSGANPVMKDSAYAIQWYVSLTEASNLSVLNGTYTKYAKAMNEKVARAYKAQQLSGKTSVEYDNMLSEYRKYADNSGRNTGRNAFNETSTLYVFNKYIKPIRTLANNTYNNVFVNNTKTDGVNNYLSQTSTQLKDNYKKIKNAKALVDDSISDLEAAREELNNNTNSAYDAWGTALGSDAFNGKSSEVKDSSQNARDSEETKEFREKVTIASIDAMIARLNNIQTLLQNMMDLIDSYKYNGKKVKDISSYSTFKNKSDIDENQIVINKSTLEANAKNSFEFSSGDVSSVAVNDNNHPDLEHEPVPSLYRYMKDNLKNANEEDSNKKLYEKVKDLNDNDEEIVDDYSDELSTKEIGSGGGEKEKISKKISNISNNIVGIFGGIGDAVTNPSSVRDTLYIHEYAMNMFSYHTYNKEGLYNLALEAEEPGLDNLNKVIGYRTKYAEAWKNEKTTFTENKTLTNKMINLENNYSFGNELEYILNGKSNSANKSAISAKIFMVRYAFNLGPEFSENWGSGELNTFAGSINTACPFIPAALVKTVVILALTAAESGYDLTLLKEGMKVKLVKSTEDLSFVFSVEAINQLVGDNASGKAGTGTSAAELKGFNYFQYSDYLSIFLFVDLVNNAQEDKILTNIGNVIGRNVGVAKGLSNADTDVFNMSEANTYYSFTVTMNTKPMLLSLPIMQDDRFNKKDSTTWFSWDYKITRGYS